MFWHFLTASSMHCSTVGNILRKRTDFIMLWVLQIYSLFYKQVDFSSLDLSCSLFWVNVRPTTWSEDTDFTQTKIKIKNPVIVQDNSHTSTGTSGGWYRLSESYFHLLTFSVLHFWQFDLFHLQLYAKLYTLNLVNSVHQLHNFNFVFTVYISIFGLSLFPKHRR